MMPLPTQETLRLVTRGMRSARTHTHRKMPTICLLAARWYPCLVFSRNIVANSLTSSSLLDSGFEVEGSLSSSSSSSDTISSTATMSEKLTLAFRKFSGFPSSSVVAHR